MTYDEALTYWYGRIDFEKRQAKPGELKLDRMRSLLRALGDPQKRLRILHVAGTKGKGSTTAMLGSVLQRAGYSVGLFTSPHLEDVSERIQVNGQPISRDEIIARIREIQPAVEKIEKDPVLEAPTFFEVGTAMGLLHFLYRRTDFVVLEVGLGGRLDSTNVCNPLVSVITNISYDHMAQLGNTLTEIAREKSGIIKDRRPVVSTAEAPEAVAVIEAIAKERNSPLTRLGRDFFVDSAAETVTVRTPKRVWEGLNIGLLGSHQAANAAGVVATIEVLQQLRIPIPESAVRQGLAEVRWPARQEVVRRNPLVILDFAHNVASMQALIRTLEATFPQNRPRSVIFAVSNDKQVEAILRTLAPHFDHFYLTRYGNNPRCVPPEQLGQLLKSIDSARSMSLHTTAKDAWTVACETTPSSGAIVITGSVFLAGEMQSLVRG